MLSSYLPSMQEDRIDVEPEVNEHYLGMNSPYLGEDLAEEGHDVLIRPSSVRLRGGNDTQACNKHDREHVGKVNISWVACGGSLTGRARGCSA